MLKIYPVILSFIEEVAPFIARIARHDPDSRGSCVARHRRLP
jgi:hypothetical protein